MTDYIPFFVRQIRSIKLFVVLPNFFFNGKLGIIFLPKVVLTKYFFTEKNLIENLKRKFFLTNFFYQKFFSTEFFFLNIF